MARITNEVADKYYSKSFGNYFKLEDNGDVARVQFMFDSLDEIPVFSVHTIKVDGKDRYVDCLREPREDVSVCPLCAAKTPTKVVRYVTMYDTEEQEVKIWERGKRFMETLAGLINRYSPLSEHCFEIERRGKKGDKQTTYSVFPAERAEVVDLSEVEEPTILGSAILEMSASDMEDYLDGNYTPSSDTKKEEKPVVRRRGREAF